MAHDGRDAPELNCHTYGSIRAPVGTRRRGVVRIGHLAHPHAQAFQASNPARMALESTRHPTAPDFTLRGAQRVLAVQPAEEAPPA
jgi:hypothetical protein